MSLQRLFPWALRVAWAVLPFTAGPALGDALDPRSRAVQLVGSVGLWSVWGVVLAATLVLRPISLTAVRCASPAGAAVALAAAVDGYGSPLAVSTTALAMGFAFLPEVGTLFVNGPAYPNERRFLLRAPAPLLLGMLGVVWALALADPVLFRRQLIVSLGPADAATTALDLTQTAPGLALELALTEEVPILRARPGKKLGEAASPSALLFTPTRPGAVLREAAERNLPIR